MELKPFYGKKVVVVATNGRVFSGTVNDYFYPDENDLDMESIVVDTLDGDVIEFTEEDIETITEM